MYEGSKVILYGKYKTMKSMIAMRLGLAIAGGEDWLGFKTSGGKTVMYLQLEIPPVLLQRRFVAMNAEPTDKLFVWTESNISIDTDEGMSQVEDAVNNFGPDLLIVDPIYKVMSGNLVENSQVKLFIDRIDKLMDDFKPLSTMLVSHTRKGQYEEAWGSDDLIGGVFFSAWADSVIKIERVSGSRLKAHFDVVRHAEQEISARELIVTPDINFHWDLGDIHI